MVSLTDMQIDHALAILAVEDLARAARFYDALGWTHAVDTPVYVELSLPRGQRLGLYQREAFAKNIHETPVALPPGRVGPTELYFYANDLENAQSALCAAGARELSPLALRPWEDEAVYFADPDGNVVVLARRGT